MISVRHRPALGPLIEKKNPGCALFPQDQLANKSAMRQASSSPPQILVLLQYQTLAHRIKATVLRAVNLDLLGGTSAPAGNASCSKRVEKYKGV